jgi:hypothetical protein
MAIESPARDLRNQSSPVHQRGENARGATVKRGARMPCVQASLDGREAQGTALDRFLKRLQGGVITLQPTLDLYDLPFISVGGNHDGRRGDGALRVPGEEFHAAAVRLGCKGA